MNIIKTHENDTINFCVEGRLDTTTAPKLQNMLIPAFDLAKDIILDFAKLEYVSSAGLRILLMGQKTAKTKDLNMKICNVSADIYEVFEMTGLDDLLDIETAE